MSTHLHGLGGHPPCQSRALRDACCCLLSLMLPSRLQPARIWSQVPSAERSGPWLAEPLNSCCHPLACACLQDGTRAAARSSTLNNDVPLIQKHESTSCKAVPWLATEQRFSTFLDSRHLSVDSGHPCLRPCSNLVENHCHRAQQDVALQLPEAESSPSHSLAEAAIHWHREMSNL